MDFNLTTAGLATLISTHKIQRSRDYKDMAKNAIKLLSDETKLQTFKKQAFEQAKKFDIENILPLYEKLYQEVIETK